MVLFKTPPDLKVVGEFKGPRRSWALTDGLFDKYVDKLRQMGVAHSLTDFWANGGMGGGSYPLANVPRVTLRDGKGELELLVEAYTRGAGHPCIKVYSTEPERAREVLGEQFTPDEFGQ